MMTTILSIDASQRLDSRGNPTVQVCLRTDKGKLTSLSAPHFHTDILSAGTFRSIVPSGASKGDYEAAELRDGNEKEYHGQGVLGAVENVTRVLAPQIIDKNFQLPEDVRKIDAFMIELDGTQDKGKLGANAILAISMAVWRAAASAKVCLEKDRLKCDSRTLVAQTHSLLTRDAGSAALPVPATILRHPAVIRHARAVLQCPQWRCAFRQYNGFPRVHDCACWRRQHD